MANKKRAKASGTTPKGQKTYDRFIEQPGTMRNVKRAPNLNKAKRGK